MVAEVEQCLTGQTVRGIAIGIVADAAKDRCPVLADALEDAGFTDAVDLAHLRHSATPSTTYAEFYAAQTGRRALLIHILSAVEPDGLDEFYRQYAKTALWSTNDQSNDRGGEPMDRNYTTDDIDTDTVALMRRECAAFLAVCAEDVGTDYSDAGHDFWLTRSGHGAGFWDGDWQEANPDESEESEGGPDMATRLTDASHWFGEVDLYVGDDGKIHQS